MALWKKILIWCGVVLGVGMVFVIVVYAIMQNANLPTLPAGDYVLTRVEREQNESYVVEEEFSGKSYYISVASDGSLTSHSADKGIEENETGYIAVLLGEEVAIYFNNEEANLAFQGTYSNNQMIIVKTIESDVFFYIYELEKTT